MTRKDIIDTEQSTPAENVRTFLLTLCVGFTTIMIVCMVLGSIFADEQAKQGINYCWSLLGACICASVLQFVFFTPTLIKRMPYAQRLFTFGVCLYAVLAVLAVTMSWFPTGMVGAWISFTMTYLIILAGATAAFAAKHRHETRELNQLLSEYHKSKG